MKILTGKIISTKMAKTATVEVVRFVAHPLYRKRMKLTKKYQVHDELSHKVGEEVNFVACAPISKTKKWRILEEKTENKKKPEQVKSEVKKAPKKEKKVREAKKVSKKTKK